MQLFCQVLDCEPIYRTREVFIFADFLHDDQNSVDIVGVGGRRDRIYR